MALEKNTIMIAYVTEVCLICAYTFPLVYVVVVPDIHRVQVNKGLVQFNASEWCAHFSGE